MAETKLRNWRHLIWDPIEVALKKTHRSFIDGWEETGAGLNDWEDTGVNSDSGEETGANMGSWVATRLDLDGWKETSVGLDSWEEIAKWTAEKECELI